MQFFSGLIQMIKLPLLFVFFLLLSACASLPDNTSRQQSHALEDTSATTLAKGIAKRRDDQGISPELTGMRLLDNGLDGFVARAALAQLAEKTLDVQYYLYHSDLSGRLLTHEILKAAERGVRVRMLLDDMDLAKRDQSIATLNGHPNIEMRVFNPFIGGQSRASQFGTRFGSVTRRMHNKSFTADNQLSIIGGRNVGDEYFDANPNLAFGDLDVALTLPAAAAVSKQFDQYWNSELAYPVEVLVEHQPTSEELAATEKKILSFYDESQRSAYAQRLSNSGIVSRAKKGESHYLWGRAEVLYDAPEKISSDREKTEYHLAPKLGAYLNKVEKELIVITPYFVPGDDGVKFFAELEQRGVQVRILTNSLSSNDVAIVHSGYVKYRKKLLEAGVELYEIDKTAFYREGFERKKSAKTREGSEGSKASLHAKYFILDRKAAFIGSLNLDPRSVVENTEIGVIVKQGEVASKLAEQFDDNIRRIAFKIALEDGDVLWLRETESGEITRFDKEPHTSWWDRFSVGVMRLLPADSQL
jgi:putative cardiolipin synthase